MSVINQMLKDLESRRQSGNDGNVLEGVAWHGGGQGRSRLPIIILLIVVLVAVIAWLMYERTDNKPVRTTTPAIIPVQPQQAKSQPEAPVVQSQQPVVTANSQAESAESKHTAAPITADDEPKTETVAETIPAPQIFSVSPEPVVATGQQTEIAVRGEGFSDSSSVFVSWRDGKRNKQLGGYQVNIDNEGLLVMKINPGRSADNWTVRVENEDGQSSEAYAFQVVAGSQPVAEKIATEQAPAVASAPGTSEPEASPVVKRARELSPAERAVNLYSQARSQLSRGELAEGEASLQRALAIRPGLHDARKLLAGVMLREGRSNEAAELLDQGLAVSPAQTDFMLLRARIYADQGNLTAAIGMLESSQPPLQQAADYYALLAAYYQRSKRHDAAAGLYTNMLKLNPSQPVWNMGLGISLEALGENERARKAYERALQSGLSGDDVRRFVSGRLQALQ